MRFVHRRARTAIALGATLAAFVATGCSRRDENRSATTRGAAVTPSTPRAIVREAPTPALGDAGEAPAGAEAAAGDGVDAAAAAKADAERDETIQILADEFLAAFSPPLIGLGASGGGGGGGGANNDGRAGGPNFPLPQQPPAPRQVGNPYGNVYNSNALPGTGTGVPGVGNGPLGMGAPTLTPAQVPVNTRGEFVVPFSAASVAKPYEADPAAGGMLLSGAFTGPSGTRWNVPGFWDGTSWRIRFAPPEAGAWKYDLFASTGGKQDRVTGSFTAVAANHPAFLRLTEHRLRGLDNAWFRGVGYNIGWQREVETLTFQQMSSDSMNLLSFWMQVPGTFAGPGRSPLEKPVGTIDQSVATYLDRVVADAESAGVRLLPSIWPHDLLRDTGHPWGNPHWSENPYSAITTPVGFFTLKDSAGHDTPQWHAQQNLYRYIVARWGTSPAIAGWVALVEANGTTAWTQTTASKSEVSTWAIAVREVFTQLDPFRTSSGYPLTVSLTGERYQTQPETLDLLSADSYEAQYYDLPSAPASNAGIAGKLVADYFVPWATVDQRLGIITEFGGDVRGDDSAHEPKPKATQPRHLHNGLWGAAGAGSTITPLLWSDGGHFPLPTVAMRAEFTRLAAFESLLAQNGFDGVALTPVHTPQTGSAMLMTANAADRFEGWLAAIAGTALAAGTLTMDNITPGTWHVTWFDTASGSTTTSAVDATVGSDRVLTVTLPGFAAQRPDVAIMAVRQATPTGNG